MKKMILLAAISAMLLGLFVVPAAADTHAVGALQGSATIGDRWVDRNSGATRTDCTSQTAHQLLAAGRGLFVPNLTVKHHVYTFKTRVVALESNANVINGQLDICGRIRPALGLIGAACGASEGHSGAGKVRVDNGNIQSPLQSKTDKAAHTGRQIDLTNVGWAPSSVGGTLIVTGDVNDTVNKQNGKAGELVAVVQAQGGQNCVQDKSVTSNQGAQNFAVVGVFAIVNS